jgi:hypothetical protein
MLKSTDCRRHLANNTVEGEGVAKSTVGIWNFNLRWSQETEEGSIV